MERGKKLLDPFGERLGEGEITRLGEGVSCFFVFLPTEHKKEDRNLIYSTTAPLEKEEYNTTTHEN